MFDAVAVISAVEETSRRANEARPDAPIVPEETRERFGGRFALARQRLSFGLRRLADLVEPAPRCPTPLQPR